MCGPYRNGWLTRLYNADKTPGNSLRLWQNPQLIKEEQAKLFTAADDLRLVIRYIEEKRMSPGAAADNLPDHKRRVLDLMVTMLHSIQGRLHNAAMEV
jgi:hypothetical protein